MMDGMKPMPGPLPRSMSYTGESNNFEFPKRKEAADTKGVLFERRLSALLFLRGLNYADSFYLATNMDKVGAFDDNIFIYKQQDCVRACFIQQKHNLKTEKGCNKKSKGSQAPKMKLNSSSSNKLTSEFLKYYTSFKEVEDMLPNFKDLGVTYENLELVFYTNAELEYGRGECCEGHLLNTADGLCFSYSPHDQMIQNFFEELNKYSSLLHELEEDTDKNNLEEKIDHIKMTIYSKEIAGKLNKLKSSQNVKKEVERLLKEIDGLIDEGTFQRFLVKLKVFHCQVSEGELSILVREELANTCGVSGEDLDSVFKTFTDLIQEWGEKDNCYLSAGSVMWKDVLNSIESRLSQKAKKQIEDLGVMFSEESIEKLRPDVLKTARINISTEVPLLTALKVQQCIQGESHILVGMEVLVSHLNEVVCVWKSSWYSVLLILMEDVSQDEVKYVIHQVSEVLKRPGKRLVLLGKHDELVRQVGKMCVIDICTLNQLDDESQSILYNRQIIFQGHPIFLGELAKQDDQLPKVISGATLMYIINTDTDIRIGKPLESEIEYYVPRTLNRVITIRKEFLQTRRQNTLFALTSKTPTKSEEIKKLLPAGVETCTYGFSKGRTHVLCECMFLELDISKSVDFQRTMSKHYFNIYWLQTRGENLDWKWSKGDMKLLNHFLEKDISNNYRPTTVIDITDRVVLLVAEPGMGKSTLLNHLAITTKSTLRTVWLAKLNLIDCTSYLGENVFDSQEKVAKLLENALGLDKKQSNPFEKLFFRHSFQKSGQIVVMLDGFDEICPTYMNQGTDLLHLLLNSQVFKLWITSRPVTSELLQRKLSAFAFTLQPFADEDQKSFLIKFWKGDRTLNNNVDSFVSQLLKLVKNSLGNQDIQVTGIPLQTMMLAESFESEIEECITKDVITLPGQLDLIHLYDRFVNKKCEIFLKDKIGMDPTNPSYQKQLKDNKTTLIKKHITLSMVLLFTEDEINNLGCQSVLKNCKEYLREFEDIEKAGIIGSVIDGTPQFVHRTFAEYFAALWFTKNYDTIPKYLTEKLFEPGFNVIRNMFDRILAKQYDLHNAVLNDDCARVLNIVQSGVSANLTDDGGRTALHLAALYNMKDITKVLIQQGGDPKVSDKVLKWLPYQYADRATSWGALEVFQEDKTFKSLNLVHTAQEIGNIENIREMLASATQHGYCRLIHLILLKGIKVTQVLDDEGSTVFHIAAKHGQTETLRNLVQYNAEIKRFGHKGRKMLHYLLKRNVKFVSIILKLAKSDVNILNNHGSTPLHLACKAGNVSTVVYLIEVGADINKLNSDGSTSLHIAAKHGYTDIVRHLLKSHTNINVLNRDENSALHLAASHGHTEIVKCLMKAGADLYDLDGTGDSAIHLAATGGHTGTIKCLVDSGVDINICNGDDETPLHIAASNGHKDTLSWLIREGADIKLRNSFNYTVLHVAVWEGHLSIVDYLVSLGVELDVTDNKKYTPLHIASREGHEDIVRCLVNSNANMDKRTNSGDTPLHIAAAKGYTYIVKYLIDSGAKLNIKDSDGGTPLFVASSKGHFEIVRSLVNAGADVNIQNATGYTPLKLAHVRGRKSLAEYLSKCGSVQTS